MRMVDPVLINPGAFKRNLARCVADVTTATTVAFRDATSKKDTRMGPGSYRSLLALMKKARSAMPVDYREQVVDVYVKAIKERGPRGFQEALRTPPSEDARYNGYVMLSIATAIWENYHPSLATPAFQAIVGDLYDGFLSDADRYAVGPPIREVLAPLVIWGGGWVRTHPVDQTGGFGIRCSVVGMPRAYARGGLLAWAALGHETSGHDVLRADPSLRREAHEAVVKRMKRERFLPAVTKYWVDRLEECAADALGILNLGPMAAVGMLGFSRGVNEVRSGRPMLGTISDSAHPADVLRGFLWSAVVDRLEFAGHSIWSHMIRGEVLNDLRRQDQDGTINILAADGRPLLEMSLEQAMDSAETVAAAMLETRMPSLRYLTPLSIQNWRDHDERIVDSVRRWFISGAPVPTRFRSGAFAAHILAAAVAAALSGADIADVFSRMKALLTEMHYAEVAKWDIPTGVRALVRMGRPPRVGPNHA